MVREFNRELTKDEFELVHSAENALDPDPDRPDYCPKCNSSNFSRGLLFDACPYLDEIGTVGCGNFAVRNKEKELKENFLLSLTFRMVSFIRTHFRRPVWQHPHHA